MRVLLVESDPGISSFIKIGLEYYDFNIDIESGGLLVTNLIFSRNYDFIILDTEIAGNLNLELCNKIMNESNMTPVLMLTSIDCVKTLVKGIDCRSEDYLIKPFKFDDLLARLKSISKTLS